MPNGMPWEKLEIKEDDIISSIVIAGLHLVLELISLNFEASAVSTRLQSYLIVCFNAR